MLTIKLISGHAVIPFKVRVQDATRRIGILSFLWCVLTRHEWARLETLKWCRTCDHFEKLRSNITI